MTVSMHLVSNLFSVGWFILCNSFVALEQVKLKVPYFNLVRMNGNIMILFLTDNHIRFHHTRFVSEFDFGGDEDGLFKESLCKLNLHTWQIIYAPSRSSLRCGTCFYVKHHCSNVTPLHRVATMLLLFTASQPPQHVTRRGARLTWRLGELNITHTLIPFAKT